MKDREWFVKLRKCRSSSKLKHRLEAEMNDSPSTDDPILSVDYSLTAFGPRVAQNLRFNYLSYDAH